MLNLHQSDSLDSCIEPYHSVRPLNLLNLPSEAIFGNEFDRINHEMDFKRENSHVVTCFFRFILTTPYN